MLHERPCRLFTLGGVRIFPRHPVSHLRNSDSGRVWRFFNDTRIGQCDGRLACIWRIAPFQMMAVNVATDHNRYSARPHGQGATANKAREAASVSTPLRTQANGLE